MYRTHQASLLARLSGVDIGVVRGPVIVTRVIEGLCEIYLTLPNLAFDG